MKTPQEMLDDCKNYRHKINRHLDRCGYLTQKQKELTGRLCYSHKVIRKIDKLWHYHYEKSLILNEKYKKIIQKLDKVINTL